MKKLFFDTLVIFALCIILYSCNSNNQAGYKSVNDSSDKELGINSNSVLESGQTIDTIKIYKTADSLGYTKISVFLSEPNSMPQEGLNLLQSRLINILTQNNVCGIGGHPRFILTPLITQTNQDITSSAPTMYSNTYDVTLYIADAIYGEVYSSISIKLQGVGQSPLKAIINAFSTLNPKDINIQKFIKQGTLRINEYFINNCDAILKESNSMSVQEKYAQALTLLESVPSNTPCYEKVSKTMFLVFKQLIDKDCYIALSNMKAELGKSNDPTASGYNETAMAYFSMINPKAKCYKEAEALYRNYVNKLNPTEKRNLEQKMQQYRDDLTKDKQEREFKEIQARLAIEGNQELLDVYRKQYNYAKLPWIRQWIHLGSFDPFDGTK